MTNKKFKYDRVYNRCFKRVIDVIVSMFLLIVLSPFLFFISLLILIDDGKPIFYRPERGGYLNHPFRIYKFRTMVKNADQIGGGTTALNDPRITKIGNFLRKTKIDEFPQLINILNGTMSFVGPRPELLKYTRQYDGIYEDILKVRPGITDFSSLEFINLDEIVGASNADALYEQKVLPKKNELRVKYAHKVSFFTDVKLFTMTISRVVKKAVKFLVGKNGIHNA